MDAQEHKEEFLKGLIELSIETRKFSEEVRGRIGQPLLGVVLSNQAVMIEAISMIIIEQGKKGSCQC